MSVVSLANRKIAERSERIKTEPTAFYCHSRGLCYKVLGMYRQALADYNKAIELEPLDSFNYVSRGDLYLKVRKYEQALADFNEYITLKKGYEPDCYELRGKCYRALGDDSRAQADFARVKLRGRRFF